MSDRLEAFAQAARECDGSYRGQYHGRSFHRGIAVDFDSYSDLMQFVVGCVVADYELHDGKLDMQSILSRGVHLDSMGLGIVASWPKSSWSEEEWELAPGLVRHDDY